MERYGTTTRAGCPRRDGQAEWRKDEDREHNETTDDPDAIDTRRMQARTGASHR
jgi:hypothetical protein